MVALGAMLSVQACVTGAVLDQERLRGAEAKKAFDDKNWPQAQIRYQAYIEARGFGSLPADVQYQALRSAAFVGLYHGDKTAGYSYLLRLVEMPEADYQAWIELLRDAQWLKHDADAARALVMLAQRWPAQLSMVDATVVSGGLQAMLAIKPEAQLSSLTALYDAHFKLRWGAEPNGSWRALTLLLLEHGQLARAIEVAGHITDAEVLMTLRIDHRFDAVVAANPARFDIDAAAREELRVAQETSDQYPQVLALKIELISAMRHLRDYEVMLAVSDELVSEIESTNFPQKLFTDPDYDDQYRWLLNLRSLALERIGQTDEAVTQLKAAARLTEEGAKNVSQVINLGELYCRLKRAHEALAVIADIGPLSAHGKMEIESIRLEAAVQLKDAPQIEQSLQFMQAHGSDGPDVLERSLVIAGHPDLAAHDLIGRLLDPAQREGALRSVQDFGPIPESDWEKEFDAGWSALIARPDVDAAIHKVGRADRYRLELFD